MLTLDHPTQLSTAAPARRSPASQWAHDFAGGTIVGLLAIPIAFLGLATVARNAVRSHRH